MRKAEERRAERDRLDFLTAVCQNLSFAPADKVVWVRCPLCGQEACAVRLGPGDRRGACGCGQVFLEKRMGR